MQPATAPGWDLATTVNSAHNRQLVVVLLGVSLYVGLMIVGFYLGVCWLQNSLGELTLSVRELKTLVQIKLGTR
jgi:hypothetical protein